MMTGRNFHDDTLGFSGGYADIFMIAGRDFHDDRLRFS